MKYERTINYYPLSFVEKCRYCSSARKFHCEFHYKTLRVHVFTHCHFFMLRFTERRIYLRIISHSYLWVALFTAPWYESAIYFLNDDDEALLLRSPFRSVDSLPFIVSDSSSDVFASRINASVQKDRSAKRQQHNPEKFESLFSRWQQERERQRILSIAPNLKASRESCR